MKQAKKPLIEIPRIRNWYNKNFCPKNETHYLTYEDREMIRSIKKTFQIEELARKIGEYGQELLVSGFSKELPSNKELWDKIEHNSKKMRKLVDILHKEYKTHPEDLRVKFNQGFKYTAGLASSAYFQLTGDISPIQSLEFGGIGCTITDCRDGLIFSRNQLQCAYIDKYALKDAKISENALYLSQIHPDALKRILPSDFYKEKLSDSIGMMYLGILGVRQNIDKSQDKSV